MKWRKQFAVNSTPPSAPLSSLQSSQPSVIGEGNAVGGGGDGGAGAGDGVGSPAAGIGDGGADIGADVGADAAAVAVGVGGEASTAVGDAFLQSVVRQSSVDQTI